MAVINLIVLHESHVRSPSTHTHCFPFSLQAVQDDAARTAGFSLLLRRLFEECEEPDLLEAAAKALGRLVKNSGQSIHDIVERQVWGLL